MKKTKLIIIKKISEFEILELNKKYKKGLKIKMICMKDDIEPIKFGITGKITGIDFFWSNNG
jgi:hypothetical protein